MQQTNDSNLATSPRPLRPLRVLRVDASARADASVSRQLADRLLSRMIQAYGSVEVSNRDVSTGLPFVTAEWVAANSAAPDDRTVEQVRELALSDQLVDELVVADVVLLASPIYNFGIPASLKAWVDLVARVGRTFRYTESGPLGLLKGKRAFVLLASGGTKVGSEIDFASGYLRHILGFLGVQDVTLIAADQGMRRGADALTQATEAIDLHFQSSSLQLESFRSESGQSQSESIAKTQVVSPAQGTST